MDLPETVSVYAKIRPSAGPSAEEVVVKRRFDQQKSIQARNLEFSLDWVWDKDATQEEVYALVGSARVARVMEGCNVCLIAYGQTGSGKTYTMVRSSRSSTRKGRERARREAACVLCPAT